jgi:hypothetical protein
MSIDGAGVSESNVGDDPRSSSAGPSIDSLDKLTKCLLQLMGMVVGVSAAATEPEPRNIAAA